MSHHHDGTRPTSKNGQRSSQDPSLRRVLREDEHATPAIARRQITREISELLEKSHSSRQHPTMAGFVEILNRDHKQVRVVSAEIAAEAEYLFRSKQAAPDPALLPIEEGGDGKRVDPLRLCRELGLPVDLADRRTGEVLLTAAMAQAILARNAENRPIRRDYVHRYEEMMDEDRWMLSPDAITIDSHGRLINGQHRLEALARVCKPQRFLVVLDADPRTFAVIDSGRPRTPADALHIAGYSHRYQRASVIRCVILDERGILWMPGRRIESDEIVSRAGEMEPRLTSCILDGEAYTRRSKRLVNSSKAAFLLWAYDADHSTQIREYLDQLAKGFGLEEGDPAAIVREALIVDRDAHPKPPGIAVLALLVRGAEAYLAGTPMRSAKIKGSAAWPTISTMGWPEQTVPRQRRRGEAGSQPTRNSS